MSLFLIKENSDTTTTCSFRELHEVQQHDREVTKQAVETQKEV